MNRPIRVLIADDHAIVRQGLRQILSETEDMIVAGEAANGVEALARVREGECEVVLMDVSMPDRNGIDALKLIKKEFPRLPVLVLSMYPEDQYAVRALKAGASGYLTKQSAPEQLVQAIRTVAAGRKYVSASLAQELANAIQDDGDKPLHEKLSDREYQTLCMIASGKTLSQIAAELNLSVKTVSVYRARLLEKMRMKNNAELTHYGLKCGLVE
ncbi:MAG TPA: DNA-binding response regulator [Rhodocyclaceae bacterium]|nr:MAG: DNA-binding response regulator [Betaproteobacteria bacterium CG2_30_68_42]PIV72896.1 MAG: DNA-binding response regulator [Rhodocyclales bacterium CG17_big_fil_post_rev_8_21_14_2_50_68_7]PIX75006.1 MAG: DNA-binding response regulator [Rhodocyclales bacterium CG_4_10_14_3_um_filter_68_10]PJA58648.1 MAG: DNA-binding response regulator [Rhodocyclales bacterium CG_4_9_14_3_um_filter_68_10]HCX32790.1 DNA-binding response regulator [Rhodocyclaceae bacterium]